MLEIPVEVTVQRRGVEAFERPVHASHCAAHAAQQPGDRGGADVGDRASGQVGQQAHEPLGAGDPQAQEGLAAARRDHLLGEPRGG